MSPVYDEVLEDIKQRDYNDMHRDIAPLKQADDAVLLDTSSDSPERALKRLIGIIKNETNI